MADETSSTAPTIPPTPILPPTTMTNETPSTTTTKTPAHRTHAWRQTVTLQHQLGLLPPPNSNSRILNFPPEPIFLSLDLEAHEFCQSKITEFGISVLDTRDLHKSQQQQQQQNSNSLTPTSPESEWLKNIKSAHFRPEEYAGLVNRKYVKGCPESFNFGHTEWISLSQAKEVLRRVFRAPGLLHWCGKFGDPELVAELEAAVQKAEVRDVVLVGHGLGNDRKYLRELGFELAAADVGGKGVGVACGSVDTQVLAGSSKRFTVGLARLVGVLGLEGRDLHNAGNDAALTLRAMILKVRRDFLEPGVVEAKLMRDWEEEEERSGVRAGLLKRTAGERRAQKLARRAERRERRGLPAEVEKTSLHKPPV